jgi:hypothetical protein
MGRLSALSLALGPFPGLPPRSTRNLLPAPSTIGCASIRTRRSQHLVYLRRDRGEVPKPGDTLLWFYELPLPARH